MRKLVVLALYISAIIFAAGCGDDDDKGPTGPEPGGDLIEVSGAIENWNIGSGKKLYFSMPVSETEQAVFGSADITENGSFKIHIEAPASEHLFALADFIGASNCQSNTSISDPSVLGAYGEFNVVEGENLLGYVDRTNHDYSTDSVGSFYSLFMYVDKNVTISGADSCQLGNGMMLVKTFNLSLAEGWNQIAVTTTFFNSEEYHVTYSTDEPAGGKFLYFEYSEGLAKKNHSSKSRPLLKY